MLASSNAPESSASLLTPPEESFDEKYNKRMEFPISLVSAVLIHVIVGAALVVLLVYLVKSESDHSAVSVSLVQLTGLDDKGEGEAGAAPKGDDSRFTSDAIPDSGRVSMKDPTRLPEANQNTTPIGDPTQLPMIDDKNDEFEKLAKKIRDGLGSPKANGGKKDGDTPGKGAGGTGADSTQARNLRWVLRFRVANGRDYLDQLKLMGAEVLIPVPDSDKCILIPDLNKRDEQRTVTEDDLKRLATKVKFSDKRPEAVKAVSITLGVDKIGPKAFWAFFPKELEDELAKKETTYKNRRSEDIEETIFRVRISGETYEIVVEEQKLKK